MKGGVRPFGGTLKSPQESARETYTVAMEGQYALFLQLKLQEQHEEELRLKGW